MKYFGGFVQHIPSPEVEDDGAKAAPLGEQAWKQAVEDLAWQYTYVHDKLGEACFLKWYRDFRQAYTPVRLAELRLEMAKRLYSA